MTGISVSLSIHVLCMRKAFSHPHTESHRESVKRDTRSLIRSESDSHDVPAPSIRLSETDSERSGHQTDTVRVTSSSPPPVFFALLALLFSIRFKDLRESYHQSLYLCLIPQAMHVSCDVDPFYSSPLCKKRGKMSGREFVWIKKVVHHLHAAQSNNGNLINILYEKEETIISSSPEKVCSERILVHIFLLEETPYPGVQETGNVSHAMYHAILILCSFRW